MNVEAVSFTGRSLPDSLKKLKLLKQTQLAVFHYEPKIVIPHKCMVIVLVTK